MRTLTFIVSGQNIKKDPSCDFGGLVAGTRGYLQARFVFGQEWAGCRKAAVFTRLAQDYPAPIINNACEIPAEALTYQSFGVRVVGERDDGYRITTNRIQVRQGG